MRWRGRLSIAGSMTLGLGLLAGGVVGTSAALAEDRTPTVVQPAAAPSPTMVYEFAGNFTDAAAGSTIQELPSCPRANRAPCNASSTFGSDTIGTYWEWATDSASAGGGFTLDANQDFADSYTIWVKFAFTEVNGYRKIIDYQNRTSDNGFYFKEGKLLFYPDTSQSTSTTYAANQIIDLVAVRDGSTKTFTVTVQNNDGSNSGTFTYTDPGTESLPSPRDILGFFYDDTKQQTERTPGGKIYSLRVWRDRALTPDEVRQSLTSPTATTGAATSIDNTSATLNGTVAPNGAPTTPAFTVCTDAALTTGCLPSPSVSPASLINAGAVTAQLTGLFPGRTYYYRLSATNSAGSNDGAVESFTTTTAAIPVVRALFTPASGYVVVDWAPYSWGSFNELAGEFQIQSRKSGETTWSSLTPAPGTVAQAIDTTQRELGATYEYRVRAVPAPTEGLPSRWGLATVDIPNPALNLVITPGDTSAVFSWVKVAGIDTYRVTALTGTTVTDATVTCTSDPCSYRMTGLTNGATYQGYVTGSAMTGRTVARSSDVMFTPAVPTLPKPSVAIAWVGADGTQASLDWAPYNWGTLTPQKFEIKWITDGGATWNPVDNSATPLKQNVVINGVGPAGQPVAFNVRAIAADGTTSDYGRVGSIVPQPFALTATAGNQSISGTFTPYPATTGQFSVKLTDAGGKVLQTQTLGAAGPFTFTGLTNGTTYEAYVVYDEAGSNKKSNVVRNLIPKDKKLSQPQPTATWDPAKGSVVTWPWTDADWGMAGKGRFQVSYVDDSVPYTVTSFTPNLTIDAGVLRRNVAHVITVVAVAGDGTKSSTGQTSITPPFANTFVSAAPGDASIAASFPWVAGATSIQIGLKPDGGMTNYTTVPCDTAGVCSHTFTGLTNGTRYELWISAVFDARNRVIGFGNRTYVTPQLLPQPLNLVYPVKSDLHVGQPTVLSPTAAGGAKPYAFKQGSTPLPKGLSLNATTGEISGTPEVAVDGLYPIVISDQSGQSLTAPLRLVVAAHTLTVSYPDHAGHVGTAFTMASSVSHALGAVSYALTKGTLPAGLTFDKATGTITGTPTAATSGPVALEVTATDTYASATAAFTITIDSGTAKLSASYPNATGHVGKIQTVTPTVSGVTGATTFAVTAGTLPLGVNLDPSTGVISGTPAAAQAAQPITVRVTDSSTSVDVTFTIEELAHTLSVAYPSSTGDVGVATTVSPVVSHTIGTVTYALTSGTLPAGLALDPVTGVITGTPTQVTSGAVQLTVTATDGYGSASSALTITVTAVTPPVATIDATLSRDVDRMTAVGSVVGAPAGTTITPWYRLPGDTGYTAGVPVTLDANGGFTWTRKVNRSKTSRVYFTVSGVQSTTLVGQAPKVEVTGSRTGTSLLVTATTVNIAPGSTVKPYIKIDGGKAIRGTQLQVAADGTFAWTYIAQKGQQIRVKFNVRGVKSDPIVL